MCCCSVSGEEGCLRAHEGEGLRLERGQKSLEWRQEGRLECLSLPGSIPGVGDPVLKLGVPEDEVGENVVGASSVLFCDL